MKLSWTFEHTVDRKIVAHSVWLFETNYIRMCVCVCHFWREISYYYGSLQSLILYNFDMVFLLFHYRQMYAIPNVSNEYVRLCVCVCASFFSSWYCIVLWSFFHFALWFLQFATDYFLCRLSRASRWCGPAFGLLSARFIYFLQTLCHHRNVILFSHR